MPPSAKPPSPRRHSPAETCERLRAILRGAFAGPPPPRKDIPKRNKPATPKSPRAEDA